MEMIEVLKDEIGKSVKEIQENMNKMESQKKKNQENNLRKK